MINEGYVDCPEVQGKTLKTLRIYHDAGEGTEVQIDFPDGTIFTCCFGVKATVEASLSRTGVGLPETLTTYNTR